LGGKGIEGEMNKKQLIVTGIDENRDGSIFSKALRFRSGLNFK